MYTWNDSARVLRTNLIYWDLLRIKFGYKRGDKILLPDLKELKKEKRSKKEIVLFACDDAMNRVVQLYPGTKWSYLPNRVKTIFRWGSELTLELREHHISAKDLYYHRSAPEARK
jgi:hypothetical protein